MFVKRDSPSPGSDRSKDGVHCDLCGSSNPAVRCDKCSGHSFCLSCDDMYHRHPKRKQHLRKAIDSISLAHGGGNLRQPLPPGQRNVAAGDPSKMPIPPPRKKKGKSFFPTFGSSNSDVPALPKKEFSITEKLGSIRRFMSNRPLPPIPKDELPLKGVLKPPGYQPESSPMSERRNIERALNNPGSPQYQNIMAHLTKVAQNSADEWEEDPSVSTSGSTRGSSGGDDIGWGQEFNAPPKKAGGPPILQHRGRDGSRNLSPPPGRMQQSTSMVDLQGMGTGVPVQQPLSPGFYPAPYPHFYAPPPGMNPQGYPGGFTNYPTPFYRGSFNNLRSKDGEVGNDENADGEDDSHLDGGTLTRHKNQTNSTIQGQMKRSQSVMYDPMMVPNAMFPFGGYPPPGYPNQGYFPPYWAPQTPQQQRLSTPPSPTASVRSLNRINNRERSRKHYQQQRGDDSASSSGLSRESPRRRSRGHVHKTQNQQQRLESSEPEASSEEEADDIEEKTDLEKNSARESEKGSSKHESEPEETEEELSPPAVPTVPWECSFCTFINAAGTRVCSICCKTISATKSGKSQSIRDSSPSPSSSVKTNEKDSSKTDKKSQRSGNKKEEILEFTPDLIKEQEELEKEIRKQIEATRKLRGGSPGVLESPISLATETTTNREERESSVEAKSSSKAYSRSSSPVSSPIPESDTHSQSITVPLQISSTQQVVNAIPKNIKENVSEQLKPSNESVTTDSIQTTISTDVPRKPLQKSDSSCQTNGDMLQSEPMSHSIAAGPDNTSEVSPEESLNSPSNRVETGTSPLPNEMYPANLLDVPNVKRSVSQSSLKDEVIFSNQNMGQISQSRDFPQRGAILRSLSRVSLTSEPGFYGSSEPQSRGQLDFDQQKRFTGSDWRKRRPSDLTNRAAMSKSQMLDGWSSGYNQRGKQEQDYRISMEELVERKRQETIRAHGLEMVRLIRKAEQNGFLPDDLQVALNNCSEEQDPIEWLEENWTNMIETVVTLATNYGHDKPENDVGLISIGEAKAALRIHKGSIWASVTECVETRQRKFLELSARGDFTRREIIAALTAHNGNMELTYSELTRKTHKPYAMNVWGPGSGAENLDKPDFLMPEYNRSASTYYEPFDSSLVNRRPSLFDSRKGVFGDTKNFHRSMLNLHFESEFKPLNVPGYSPQIERRSSFTGGQLNNIQRPMPYNRYQAPKSNYDVSDTQSILSEDFETMTTSTRGLGLNRRESTRSERLYYGLDKSPKNNQRRSTSFLNKLSTLRKTKPKTEMENYEDESLNANGRFNRYRGAEEQMIRAKETQNEDSESKPRKKSFLNRLLNRGTPPREQMKPVELLPRDAQKLYTSHEGSRMSLQLGNLDTNNEVSAMEKVQAFLDIMPESRPASQPVKEKKGGILSRLGFRSSKQELSKPVISPENEINQSTFYVEDETIFDDQDLTLYQGFVEISDVIPVIESLQTNNVNTATIQNKNDLQNAKMQILKTLPAETSYIDTNLNRAAQMLEPFQDTLMKRNENQIEVGQSQNISETQIMQMEPISLKEKTPAVEQVISIQPNMIEPLPKNSNLFDTKEELLSHKELTTNAKVEPNTQGKAIEISLNEANPTETTSNIPKAYMQEPEKIQVELISDPIKGNQTKEIVDDANSLLKTVQNENKNEATETINFVAKTSKAERPRKQKKQAVRDEISLEIPLTVDIESLEDKMETASAAPIVVSPSKTTPVAPLSKISQGVVCPTKTGPALVVSSSRTELLDETPIKAVPIVVSTTKRAPNLVSPRKVVESATKTTSDSPTKTAPVVVSPSKTVPVVIQQTVIKPVETSLTDKNPGISTEKVSALSSKSKSGELSKLSSLKASPTTEIETASASASPVTTPVLSPGKTLDSVTTVLPPIEDPLASNFEIASSVVETAPLTTSCEEAPTTLTRRQRKRAEPEDQPPGVVVSNKQVPIIESVPEPAKPTTATRRQRPKPVEPEEIIDEKSIDSSKNLQTVRRRRSISTERSNPIRVRPTSTVPDITDTSTSIDEKENQIMKDEKEVDESTKQEDESQSRTSRAVESSSRASSTARVRRQRSISRDRTSNLSVQVNETAQPFKEAAPTGTTAKFHYLKAATESSRPKGTFIKKQSSKDGGGPSTASDSSSSVKTVSKMNAETKKMLDGPAVSSRRIALDKKIKELQAAGKCINYEHAEMAARLMEMNFDEKESLEAAKECGNLYQAISFLQQDCELCAGKFNVAEMVSMVNCTHRACQGCLKAYFTIQIRDKNILELLCPFCNEPDLGDDDVASDYFNHMDMLLKNLVDVDSHELFHRKLRDRALMKDPLFRWCSQCSSGFIITNPNQKRLLCPDCKAVTCAHCRKRWEKQHEGISCEQFLAWKEANDPEVQAAGLAQHLAENGIDCPNCNFKYSLAKGGCMHFRCVQCQFDFCSGCGKPFKMGNKCGVSEYCEKLGLHAHHPRNCLFYLRDKEPPDLQKLLDEFKVSYNLNPPEGSEVKKLCQVNEQKETNEGLKDDICGKDVIEGCGGLCRVHYLEYLGGLITKNNIDPVKIFNEDELELVLRRANIRLPAKFYRQKESEYREQLLKIINEKLPLGIIEGEQHS